LDGRSAPLDPFWSDSHQANAKPPGALPHIFGGAPPKRRAANELVNEAKEGLVRGRGQPPGQAHPPGAYPPLQPLFRIVQPPEQPDDATGVLNYPPPRSPTRTYRADFPPRNDRTFCQRVSCSCWSSRIRCEMVAWRP